MQGSHRRAEALIESGLGLYSQGDLAGALSRWSDALEVDPDNRRAREYMTYVQDHYDVLDEKFRGVRNEPQGETIEMEADDPMDELDAYDSMELQMPEPEPGEADEPEAAEAEAEPDDERTGESTKAEGLAALRRAQARANQEVTESVDEGWSLDEGWSEDGPALRQGDTLEMVRTQSFLDDLSDLGAHLGDEADTETEGTAPSEPDKEEEDEASAIQRPSDDSTGEMTRPEPRTRRARTPSPPLPAPPAPHPEFDLAVLEDVDREPAVAEPPAEEAGEVRVTFRAPRDSDNAPTRPPRDPLDDSGNGDEDEATAERTNRKPRPFDNDAFLASGAALVDDVLPTFEDETYERPSLRSMTREGSELDALDGPDADDEREDSASGVLHLAPRPSSESEGTAERETTQLYKRDLRAAKQAASMELIAAELESDLDDAVGLDSSEGEDAIKARVSWLIGRARSENLDGRFSIAVVAIDLALEEHPDSAVAQKLIHSNRELLYEVFKNFLGDMRAVPTLAMPMEMIPMQELDHRAAFLLSRIDGALTLDDVLDVSGMARLEALRHLSRLLLRGILDLRH